VKASIINKNNLRQNKWANLATPWNLHNK